jgi:hypothetical protein
LQHRSAAVVTAALGIAVLSCTGVTAELVRRLLHGSGEALVATC